MFEKLVLCVLSNELELPTNSLRESRRLSTFLQRIPQKCVLRKETRLSVRSLKEYANYSKSIYF